MESQVRVQKETSGPIEMNRGTVTFIFVTAFVFGTAFMIMIGIYPEAIKPAKTFFGLLSPMAWLISAFNPREVDPVSQISREATRRFNVLGASCALFYFMLDTWAA